MRSAVNPCRARFFLFSGAWPLALSLGVATLAPSVLAQDDGSESGVELAPDDLPLESTVFEETGEAANAANAANVPMSEPAGAKGPTPLVETQGTPEATAASVSPAVAESKPDNASIGHSPLGVESESGTKIFGAYRVRIAAAKPTFKDGLKFYDDLYGSTSWYPTISADWFAFDWYATLGVSLKAGFYTVDGHAAKKINKRIADVMVSDVEKDENGKTSFTFIPLQLALAAEFTPFQKKWIVIDGWLGYERTYWQEVRTGASEDVKAAAMMLAESTADDGDDTLTNKGWKNATVMGVAANILLNPLDPAPPASMRSSMGLGYVYLSPYVEFVKGIDDDGLSFDRSVYAIGFTFETIR